MRDLSQQLGKLPPQAIDLEEAVIGAVVSESEAIHKVVASLQPENFYLEAHQIIYRAVLDLHKAGNPIDMRSVVHQLARNGKLEIAGGAYRIAELCGAVSSSANIEYHAKILLEKSLRRNLILMASELHSKAYDDTVDVFDTLDSIPKQLEGISEVLAVDNTHAMRDVMREAVEKLASTRGTQAEITGVPSGILRLDAILLGWQPSDMVIMAGRPGMGKTAFALTVGINAAADFGVPVGFFSLEMARLQLALRAIAIRSDIPLMALRQNRLNELDWQRLGDKTSRLASCPFYLDDSSSLTIMELRSRIRRLVMKYGVRVVFIDYLQLLKGDKAVRDKGNREREISQISQTLKAIAKELDITVIPLAQLSRDVEKRPNKRPQLSDLRESGSLEQDADVVVFLYRPEYYKITSDSDGTFVPGLTVAIVAKHRNGSVDDAFMVFNPVTTGFRNADYIYISQAPVETMTVTQKPVDPSDLPF